MSDGHLWAASQQGQSSPGAPIVISAFAAGGIAVAAAMGTTTRLKASSAAKMDSSNAHDWTLMPATLRRQLTALCILKQISLER